jgi:1-acyl-sn-glycerol-3-phosphate acyltransferase
MGIQPRHLSVPDLEIGSVPDLDEPIRDRLIMAGRRALVTSDGWQEPPPPAPRTARPRSGRSSRGPVTYRMAKAALGPALRLAYQVDVEGLENVPTDQGVILAANHRSFMDSIFLALASPEPVAFVAKAEYFDRPVTRWIFRSTGQIPLRRGSPAAAREAIAAASDVLVKGGTVGIYPEGTRSRDGKLYRGNIGPARLAAATDSAIVPVGLIGTDRVQLPGERVPHLFRPVKIRFGAPVRVATEDGAGQLRAVTDGLMQDIATLCGEEYEDSFAPTPS